MARGNRATLRGLNIIGMRRSGLPRAEIHALRQAYSDDVRPRPAVSENLDGGRSEFADFADGAEVVDFLTSRDKRYFRARRLSR